jgi:hypothetical protein
VPGIKLFLNTIMSNTNGVKEIIFSPFSLLAMANQLLLTPRTPIH